VRFPEATKFGLTPDMSAWSAVSLIGGLLIVSSLTYHLVEVPLRRLIRNAWQSPTADRVPLGERRWNLCGIWLAMTVASGLFVIEGKRIRLFDHVDPPAIQTGEEVTVAPLFEHAEAGGWSMREPWGFWSDGREAVLTLKLSRPTVAHPAISLKGTLMVCDRQPTQTVRVRANNVEIGRLSATMADRSVDTVLALPPAALSSDGKLTIRFEIASPISPESLGNSDDRRLLGFGLTSMRLVDLDRP
jgi:DNA-binding transcriptional ArsR family regulator